MALFSAPMHWTVARLWFPARVLVAVSCALAVASGACHRDRGEPRAKKPASGDEIEIAVTAFLEQRGDLCVNKMAWPIEVTDHDVQARTDNAIQLPVLERVGLVSSAPLQPGPGRSYALTALGRQSYLERKTPEPSSDLCVGKLSLDKIVRVQHQTGAAGEQQVIVYYTYHFAVADWVRNAEVQAVFPMLAQILAGERAAEMELRFKRTPAGWVVLDPRA